MEKFLELAEIETSVRHWTIPQPYQSVNNKPRLIVFCPISTMLSLSAYNSGSESASSDSEESNSAEKTLHLQPIDKEFSVAKSLDVCAAPLVVASGSQDVQRVVDPTTKELQYNPKYEELFAPVQGPANPNLTDQMKAQRNTLSGYVEKAHISAFQFENQRRTFHTYGYALDPSVDTPTNTGQNFVGDLQVCFILLPLNSLN